MTASNPPGDTRPPSLRELYALFFPLALSGAFFPVARPFVNAALARTENPELALAAFSVALSLTMPIVSPLFGMRQIVTALCVDRDMITRLGRLVWVMGGISTSLLLVLAVPSVYVWFTDTFLGIPTEIALLGPAAMLLLATNPLLSVGRGYYQGILVHYGHAGPIGLGALGYLALSAGVAFGAVLWADIPGAPAAALALLCGNLAYVLIVWLPSRRMLRASPGRVPDLDSRFPDARRTTRATLGLFYPLAVSTVLTALLDPIIQAAIARTPAPSVSLAAYPVCISVAWLARTHVWNAQQVVIARVKDNATYRSARTFALSLSGATTVLVGVILVTPLSDWIFGDLIGVRGPVKEMAVRGFALMAATPVLQGLRSLYHGTLIALRATGGIQTAAFLRVLATVLALGAGVVDGRMPGLYVAIVATILAEIVEVLSLHVSARRVLARQP